MPIIAPQLHYNGTTEPPNYRTSTTKYPISQITFLYVRVTRESTLADAASEWIYALPPLAISQIYTQSPLVKICKSRLPQAGLKSAAVCRFWGIRGLAPNKQGLHLYLQMPCLPKPNGKCSARGFVRKNYDYRCPRKSVISRWISTLKHSDSEFMLKTRPWHLTPQRI